MFLICFFLKIYKYNDSKDYKLTRESWPWHHFSCSCTCCSTTTCFASIHTTCYHTTHFTSFLSTFTYHHESNHQPIKYRLRMSNILQQKMNQQLNSIESVQNAIMSNLQGTVIVGSVMFVFTGWIIIVIGWAIVLGSSMPRLFCTIWSICLFTVPLFCSTFLYGM